MNTDQPWFTLWTQPRQTIARIVAETPTRMVLPLAALAGIADALSQNRSGDGELANTMPGEQILIAAVVIGPILGIIALYAFAALTWLTGRWINGEGTPQSIRAAFAWASIPKIAAMFVMLPLIVLYGPEILTGDADIDVQAIPEFLILGLLLVIMVVLRAWGLIVYLHCLGQVQGFSAWKALGNTMLAVLVIAIPIAVLALFLSAVSR